MIIAIITIVITNNFFFSFSFFPRLWFRIKGMQFDHLIDINAFTYFFVNFILQEDSYKGYEVWKLSELEIEDFSL